MANMAGLAPLPIAKPLDCTPKVSPQGPFLYLAADSFLRLNTKVQLSNFIIWLHWLTCLVRTFQLSLAETSPFLLKRKVTPAKTKTNKNHLLLLLAACFCLIQRQPPTPG